MSCALAEADQCNINRNIVQITARSLSKGPGCYNLIARRTNKCSQHPERGVQSSLIVGFVLTWLQIQNTLSDVPEAESRCVYSMALPHQPGHPHANPNEEKGKTARWHATTHINILIDRILKISSACPVCNNQTLNPYARCHHCLRAMKHKETIGDPKLLRHNHNAQKNFS